MNESADNNVVTFLARAAQKAGSRTALAFDDRNGMASVSFAQLWDCVDRASVLLKKAGLSAGDRAILMIPMSVDLYSAMLAVLKLGAIAVFVDPWVGRRQIAAFAAYSEPAAWIGNGKSHLLRLIDSKLRKIPLTVTTGSPWFGIAAQHRLKEYAAHSGDNAVAPVSADSPALITFTSGSSGLPKGANRRHGFLMAQHRALSNEFPMRDDDIDMPMFPVFALNNLASGIPSIIPSMDFRRADIVDAKTIVAEMIRYGVTTTTASPPFIDRVVEYIAKSDGKPPHLRRILTGGAPVTDRQLSQWRRVLPNVEIVVVYGSTEAEPVAHITAEERLSTVSDVRPSTPGYCVGQPSSQITARIVRITPGPIILGKAGWADWHVASGEIGEVVVCGDHVARDYFRNPVAVAENKIVGTDGAIWHRMGDTGYLDTGGRLWLVGRIHSTIFRAGVPIHPQLVEQAAAGDDQRVRRVAAIGLPDPVLGQRVVAVVETDMNGIAEEMRKRVVDAGLPVDEIVLRRRPLPLDPRHRSKVDYQQLYKQMLR